LGGTARAILVGKKKYSFGALGNPVRLAAMALISAADFIKRKFLYAPYGVFPILEIG
jgi:hypothetical protein